MHCIIGVFHEKELDVNNYFDRFLYSNIDMYKVVEDISIEEARANIQKEIERLENINQLPEWELTDWDRRYLEGLKNEETSLTTYAEYYDYIIEEDRLVKIFNSDGECDYYIIGGRWDGELVDWDGNHHNTLRIQDINKEESLKAIYAVVNEYKGDDFFEQIGETKEAFHKCLDEAMQFSESKEEEVYLTIVDIHT